MSKKKKKKRDSKSPAVWREARRKYSLSARHIQMARELGLNPRKFGSYANHRQQPWKRPLPEFIEELYENRFGRTEPRKPVADGDDQTCPRDGFPLIKINGRHECVAEYIDRCIGNQKVTDVIQQRKTVYYLFENGHKLPLLCFCCGAPLAVKDFEENRTQMQGRHLESMSMGDVEFESGKTAIKFQLEFSAKEPSDDGTMVPVAFEAAVQMKHPTGCPHR